MANEKKVWDYLVSAGMTKAGAAGMMGNLQGESGIISNRMEMLLIQRLKEYGKGTWNDKTYTAAIDNGTISRAEFLNPLPGKVYGYGLAQWTSTSRKAKLYDLAKKKGVSIGDLDMQLEFLVYELKTSYPGVWSTCTTSNGIKTCSDKVLRDFEGVYSGERSKVRYGYSKAFYDQFVNTEVAAPAKPTGSTVTADKVVAFAKSCLGMKESDGTHRKIVDGYNKIRPLPRGYKVQYTDPWCATFVSYVSYMCGTLDVLPAECGCPDQIVLFQKLGEWVEDDAYCPNPGDVIYYDWQDGSNHKTTDNRGVADHVGIVESVGNQQITVIEGNRNDSVARRIISLNGQYIRGYGVPKYAASSGGSGGDVPAKTLYKVQAACFPKQNSAELCVKLIKDTGVAKDAYYYYKDGYYIVAAGAFTNKAGAEKRLADLKEKCNIVGMIW